MLMLLHQELFVSSDTESIGERAIEACYSGNISFIRLKPIKNYRIYHTTA